MDWGYNPQCELLEIDGFADASKFAYFAVVYLRLIQTKEVLVTLQVAKTRIAPLKTLSISCLELCTVLLLAQLVQTFIESFPIKVESVHLWSDSADVLFWLKDHPSRWGVFVANRCKEIILCYLTHTGIAYVQVITLLILFHEVLSPQN